MKSGRGKISSSSALLFPPWYMARVFFFLIRIFFLMSNRLLLLPPALPLLLLRLHRLLHLLEAGKIFLNFQIFKQHFVSRTYFYSSPRRRRLWPRRPHQGAHSVRAAPAEGGRETVCNIAKIIRKTWYFQKKSFCKHHVEEPVASNSNQDQQQQHSPQQQHSKTQFPEPRQQPHFLYLMISLFSLGAFLSFVFPLDSEEKNDLRAESLKKQL